MEKSKKACCYFRVSSDRNQKIESQIFIVERFLREHPEIKIINRYIDNFKSGKSIENRDSFNEMLERIDYVDYIIISEWDRLSREEFGVKFMYDLKGLNVKVIEASTGNTLNFNNEIDRIITFFKAYEAEKERKDIVLRTKRGIQNFRENNGRWGRFKKWGKRIDGKPMGKHEFKEQYLKYREQHFSKASIARLLCISRPTLYKRLREIEGGD